jgi:hypothetical protein
MSSKNLFSNKTKQWQLARKFDKFEYSPNTRCFWLVLELAKARDPPNFCDSRRRVGEY